MKIEKQRQKRRAYGVHLTSTDVMLEYIFPEIKDVLHDFTWVDLYAGEGNLILPILKFMPENERIEFFKKHVFLFDIQEEMIEKSINNAEKYNIPSKIARNNITQRDNLESYPKSLLNKEFPIFHITNPPYLYLGYIRKHEETEPHLKYFLDGNKGYQDLYQIAMMNDLRNGIDKLIYIIPTNFLFGAAVSNKFRADFLKQYDILKMYIFEKKIFEFTGTNICICFFKRKEKLRAEPVRFIGKKITKTNKLVDRKYVLKPEYKYRAGSDFEEFTKIFRAKNPLKVKYYLLKEEVRKNQGSCKIDVIDTSNYESNEYLRRELSVNDTFAEVIRANILYIRTVDTGSNEGRVGLYEIYNDFGVRGIYVSKNTYRTSPIQIYLEPIISHEDQELLKTYFNVILEHFRKDLDSEFLTTYKYSNADYIRKYLGLTQTRSLIETFPIINNNDDRNQEDLKSLIIEGDSIKIIKFMEKL